MRHIRHECVNVERRYYCILCSAKYRRKEDLTRHLRTKHNQIDEKPAMPTFATTSAAVAMLYPTAVEEFAKSFSGFHPNS